MNAQYNCERTDIVLKIREDVSMKILLKIEKIKVLHKKILIKWQLNL